jgi:hypothetical protein
MLTSRQVFPCRHGSPAMGAADVCNLAKRAISPGVTGSVTITDGASVAQVRALRNPDRLDSQADSAGSEPDRWRMGHTRDAAQPRIDATSVTAGHGTKTQHGVGAVLPTGAGRASPLPRSLSGTLGSHSVSPVRLDADGDGSRWRAMADARDSPSCLADTASAKSGARVSRLVASDTCDSEQPALVAKRSAPLSLIRRHLVYRPVPARRLTLRSSHVCSFPCLPVRSLMRL